MKRSFFLGASSLTLVAVLLTSCGPAAKDNTTRREIEENGRLASFYGTVAGRYVGILRADEERDTPRSVELTITVVQVADGVDENRQVRMRPEVRGIFRWVEDTSGQSRIPLVGRIYPKGEQSQATSRNDVDKIILAPMQSASVPGQVHREVYMTLAVNDDYLTGTFTEVNNLNRTGTVELKLDQNK